MRFILDSDICIYLLKRTHPVLSRRLVATPAAQIGLSAITAAELWMGANASAHRERTTERLRSFLRPFEVLPFDAEAAEVAGAVLAELRGAGTPIGPYDALIAAHARALGRTLVTHNTREFQRVKGLRLADWTKPA